MGAVGDFVLAESERPLAFVACDTAFARSRAYRARDGGGCHGVAVAGLGRDAPDGHYLSTSARVAAAFDRFRYAPHEAADHSRARKAIAALAAEQSIAGYDVTSRADSVRESRHRSAHRGWRAATQVRSLAV